MTNIFLILSNKILIKRKYILLKTAYNTIIKKLSFIKTVF